jgi:dihydroflavonol-4-reductase
MILVTGATGHIGNVLVRTLARRYPGETIRVFLLPGETLDPFHRLTLQLFYGDIRQAADVREAVRGCRLVFHLAGMIDTSWDPGPRLYEINVGGTRHVVEACEAEKSVRLVYVSSVHALPAWPDGREISEIDQFPVVGLPEGYARSKSEATALVFAAARRGLDAEVAFPSGVIGPDDYRLSEMGRTFRFFYAMRSLPFVLSFQGAYNFVDVRDVVDGLISIAEKGKSGEGYILSGQQISVRDLIQIERTVLGASQSRILNVPVPVVQVSAAVLGRLARWFHFHTIITPYSIAVLLSNSRISHAKATRELGYAPRPIADSIQDSLLFMLETGQFKRKNSASASGRTPGEAK